MSETLSERLIRRSATVYLAAALCAYALPFVIIVGVFCASIL
jgi:hypothetical protein